MVRYGTNDGQMVDDGKVYCTVMKKVAMSHHEWKKNWAGRGVFPKKQVSRCRSRQRIDV